MVVDTFLDPSESFSIHVSLSAWSGIFFIFPSNLSAFSPSFRFEFSKRSEKHISRSITVRVILQNTSPRNSPFMPMNRSELPDIALTRILRIEGYNCFYAEVRVGSWFIYLAAETEIEKLVSSLLRVILITRLEIGTGFPFVCSVFNSCFF